MEIEVLDVEQRTGVTDTRIKNEVGEEEVFTFKNEKMEDDSWKDSIKNTIKNRDLKKTAQIDKKELIGTKIEI